MSLFLGNHSTTDNLCVTFYKFYDALMVFCQLITVSSALYDF